MALPILMRVSFGNSLINCDFSFHYEIALIVVAAIAGKKIYATMSAKCAIAWLCPATVSREIKRKRTLYLSLLQLGECFSIF
ncbi:MAG: hypothetical protein HDR51_01945 [Treponema sp.]|nr:hypothetical protein [Treponema sp.]